MQDRVTEHSALRADHAELAAEHAAREAELTGLRWIRIAAVARMSGINSGVLTRAANVGEIKSNGQKGHKRRLDRASVDQFLRSRDDQSDDGRR
jgi:hypothetical protein